MRVHLHCHYVTVSGRHLQVVTGDRVDDLAWSAGHWWSATVEVEGRYHYRVVDEHAVLAHEPARAHRLPSDTTDDAHVVDRWQAPDPVRPSRHSSLFSRALAVHHPAAEPAGADGVVRFRLLEPDVPPGWALAVVGSGTALGQWRPEDGVAMRPAPDGYPWWEARPDAPADLGDAYRYVLRGPDGQVAWEDGDHRPLPLPPAPAPMVVVDEAFRGRPGWRGAGVAVPVFALRGPTSLGVGRFTDLPAIVDWAAEAGLTVLQLLPVNDTIATHGWADSYPYDPVSVHALHPVYLDVLDLPGAAAVADEADRLREDLDGQDTVDYPRVMAATWRLARQLYEAAPTDPAVDAFVEAEWDWLGPYALWCVLRDRHGTADTTRWGADATYDPARVAQVADAAHPDHDEVAFHAWVQHHLRRQLDAAAAHAWRCGVALKGDLPIGVSPTSVETWVHPEWFHLGTQTGAPPDEFATDGQNWGFPTYDWARMAEDDFGWWQHRLQALGRTFDVYRIDHVLGFFRIWEIPEGASSGLLGRFRPCLPLSDAEVRGWLDDVDLDRLTTPAGDPTDVALLAVPGGWHPRIRWWATTAHQRLAPDARDAFDAMAHHFYEVRHEHLWRGHGRTALSGVAGATDLLACGEDLGMIPPQVPEVMPQFGVLSLEIERMPSRADQWRTDPATTPYLAVTSTGTHDMPVLRAWWRDDRPTVHRLWREGLGEVGAPPLELSAPVAERLVAAQLGSPSMLCILPVQDWLAIDGTLRRPDPDDEQINDPADRDNRWRYRLHLTTTELQAAGAFTARVRQLVAASGRAPPLGEGRRGLVGAGPRHGPVERPP